MAKYKSSEMDLQRLCDSVTYSGRSLEFARSTRREVVRQYIGAHCFQEGAPQPNPLNLIALYYGIIIRTLVAKHPRMMLATFDKNIKPDVLAAQTWGNRELDKMNMARTLQRAAGDALINIGIVKVAMATPADAEMSGWGLNGGEAFAKTIDLDDWRFDPYAQDFEEVGWEGHRYRACLETIRDSKIYNSNRKELTATEQHYYNSTGDERIGVMGRGRWGGEGESEDYVDLWEIYDPRRKLILTFKDDSGNPGLCSDGKPLREQEWIGDDKGPFLHLGMGNIPGQAMPKAPIMDLVDLHLAVNNLLRKQIRQGMDQKTALFVRGGNPGEIETLNATPDGCALSWSGGEPPQAVRYNGPDAANFALMTSMKDLFSYIGGNLELLGGRGAQSRTATQDKLLNENAGVGVADMQDSMTTFTTEVYRRLMWYWWHNPFKTMKAEYQLPGLSDMSIPIQSQPQQRMQGKFENMDIKIDAYSMQGSTPQMRAAALSAIVAETAPMMALLQQQGIAFDINEYLTKKGSYLDMPDLSEIFTLREPPKMETETGEGGAGTDPRVGMPANTNREYTRNNVSTRTSQDQGRVLAEAMAGTSSGGNPNGDGMQSA